MFKRNAVLFVCTLKNALEGVSLRNVFEIIKGTINAVQLNAVITT